MRGCAFGRTTLGPVLLALMAAGGCSGDSIQDTIAAKKVAIEAKLAALQSLEPKLAELPLLETSTLTIDGPPPCFFTPIDSHNAVLLQVEQFADLSRPSDPPLHLFVGQYVARSVGLVRTGLWPAGPGSQDYPPRSSKEVLEELAKLERTRYALVIRMHELELPSLDERSGQIDEDADATPEGGFPGMKFTFKGGRVSGDALLFDLTNAEHLGGVVFDVQNTANFKGRAVDLEGSLKGDLVKNLHEAIKSEVKRLIPLAEF